MRRAILLAVALACRPSDPAPLPRILSATPQGSGVPPDDVVAVVTFSEPVDPQGLADGRYFALALAADLRAVSTSASRPEGLGPDAPVVPSDASVSDDRLRAELRPRAPLAPSTGYALVVSSQVRSASGRPVLDPQGRQRTFASLFETGPMPDHDPPLPRWDEPPHGPVPANLARLRVAFSEPVSGTLTLAAAPDAMPIVVAADRLGLDLSSTLPAGPLTVSLAAVQDSAGNPALALDPIEVAACEDRAPPVIDDHTVAVDAGDLGITVSAAADEMARLGAEIAVPEGEPACGAVPAAPGTLVAWSTLAPCPGYDPCAPAAARCSLSLLVTGLCPGRRLWMRIAAEDLAGNRSPFGAWLDVQTAPPVPRPVLTEVLVDAATPEASGEYVEVANLGSGDADLAGWTLAKRTATGTVTRCALAALGPRIAPGGHALIVASSYDGRYGLSAETPVYHCGGSSLLGGLSNDHPPALLLMSPDGALVSSIGAESQLRCTERSVERVHPLGPDAAENLVCSNATPGTPAACNSATPTEECPKRPW